MGQNVNCIWNNGNTNRYLCLRIVYDMFHLKCDAYVINIASKVHGQSGISLPFGARTQFINDV